MKKICLLFLFALSFLMVSCNSGGGGSGGGNNQFSVGGTVTGLNKNSSIVLADNGGNLTTVSQNGNFTFSQDITKDSNYKVTVVTQPVGEICAVLNGSANNVDANIDDIAVHCSDQTVTIGGKVIQLASGTSVNLKLIANGITLSDLTINQKQNFTFNANVPLYSSYNIIATPSSKQEKCSVSPSSGYASMNLNNIKVSCSDSFVTISGNLVANDIPFGQALNFINTSTGESFVVNVINKNTPFSFTIPYYGSYYLEFSAKNYYCAINPNNVDNITSSLNNVLITCSHNPVIISGTVTNLSESSSIALENLTTAESKVVFGYKPNFRFKIPYDSGYNIKIINQPDGYNCNITNGHQPSGVISNQNVSIVCTEQYFSLHSFTGTTTDGSLPEGGLVLGNDGDFYGTTNSGGAYNKGSIFKITPSGTETLLYSFNGSTTNQDGSKPTAPLILATDGNFYGTTFYGGGVNNEGTIFRFDPNTDIESPIYAFSGLDGANPEGTLAQDGNYLYGTTYSGGINNVGSVFQVDLSGALTTIHSFGNRSSDGVNPISGLSKGLNNIFYGTTSYGGSLGNGTVYSVTSSGAENVLYSFLNNGDGENPEAGVVQANDGNLYGTILNAGVLQNGSVFKITLPSNTMSALYYFKANGLDGMVPLSGLIQGSDGNLYGTTKYGGNIGYGTIYKISLSGDESILYSFQGKNLNGDEPFGDLIQYSDGSFYGTTYQGGTSHLGSVFKYKP